MDHAHIETRAVHAPVVEPSAGKPLVTPLYQNHLFAYTDADELSAVLSGPQDAFLYGRYGNPTSRSLEEAMAGLEGGAAALATSSGTSAINTVLMALLSTGDHVIAQRSIYGGTYVLLQDLAERWGITVTYVSGTDPEEIRSALGPRTRLLLLETIANPTTQVGDLPALIAAVRDAGVAVMVDNTFTPVTCRPLEHGADIVVHSATKFLGGHSDVLGGVAVFATRSLYQTVWKQAVVVGSTLDPHSAWLTLRGLATLPLRFARQSANALELARRLAGHPAVTAVHYPGLPGHPQHELATRLFHGGFGAIVCLELAGGREAGRAFIEAVRVAVLAVSLGDVKTLVMHPPSTSHKKLSPDELAAAGISEGLVRIAVGVEHPDDLWTDLEQALAKAG